MWRVFRHREYVLLASGNVLNQLGMWGRMIGIGWAAQDLTDTALLVAIAHGAQFFPTLVLAPFSGHVVDRFDRRNVAVIGNLGMAVPSVIITILLIQGRLTITELILLALLGGALQSLTMPAVSALVPHAVPQADVPAAIAVNSVLSNGCRFVGAALVGVIIAAWDTQAAFAFNAISLLLVTAPWMAMRITAPPRVQGGESFGARLAGGFRFAAQTPAVLYVLVLSAVSAFMIMHQPLMPLIARDLLKSGPSTYGLLSSATGVGAIAGAVTAGRAATSGRARFVTGMGLLCTSLSVLGVAVSRWVVLSVAIQMLFGFGFFILMTTMSTVITTSTPDSHLGRVTALYSMTNSGVVPFCALSAGFLASLLGTRETLVVVGSVYTLFAIWFILNKLQHIDPQHPVERQVQEAVPPASAGGVAPAIA